MAIIDRKRQASPFLDLRKDVLLEALIERAATTNGDYAPSPSGTQAKFKLSTSKYITDAIPGAEFAATHRTGPDAAGQFFAIVDLADAITLLPANQFPTNTKIYVLLIIDNDVQPEPFEKLIIR